VGGPVSDARNAVLQAIRAALGPAAAVPEIPRHYLQAGATPPADGVDRFCQRVAEYRATVHRSLAGELERTLAAACAARGTRQAAIAPGVSWAVEGVELVGDDPPLAPRALDALGAVVTGCGLAIAETGTIVLDGSPACGRRALTLVPDHHVCVVHADQVVASVPDAIAALQGAARDGRPLTFVSGPSATSDIELERVEGVHGPRRLDVVVVS
jgi:L-lactate dehydrogenase complex protein LldG